ncbi:MAG: hypothetical protein A2X59_13485 [Nitrospirae bacterium GWC2_42_7]|nr:MAG: hypothetical protein A2X59_13485 [Nitrospirae bacterium GWC2_42_7]
MHEYMKKIIIAICLTAVLMAAGCAQKYAVLISTNEVTMDDVSYHSEWWYDLILQYKMLTENGFKDDKIYVLYGNGTDFSTIYPDYDSTVQFGHAIADMAVNKTNIQNVFNTVNGAIKSSDHLYVWWMGHGGGSGPGSCNLSMSISNTGEFVSDTEFTGYINSVLNYKKRSLAVMTCHAGGMIDNLNIAGNKTVTLTSSTCPQSSYSISSTCNSRPQAEFNYTMPNALRLKNPCGTAVSSDYNSNGYVSLSETHQYNSATMTTSTPQSGDPDSISATTQLKMVEP